MAIDLKTFTDADLNAGKELLYAHNLNTESIDITWWDNNGENRNSPNIFKVVDANNIIVYCGGVIAGQHQIVIEYADAILTGGKRFFEQSLEDDPTVDFRIGLGKAGTSSINMTLTKFLAWLQANLSYADRLLSNLSNIATARNNLAVYSKTETNNLVDTKATPGYVDTQIDSLNLNITSETLDLSTKDGLIDTVTVHRMVRYANVVTASIEFVSIADTGELYKELGEVSFDTPALQYFQIVSSQASEVENGIGYIAANGKIFVKLPKATTFLLTFTYISY